MSYARGTDVSVGKTQDDIKKCLSKYKSTGFMCGETADKSAVAFEVEGIRVRISFARPIFNKTKNKRGQYLTRKQVENEDRRLWRCLLLLVKGNLEAVESGIVTLQEVFLPYTVLADGRTMGEVALPQIEKYNSKGEMPPLLGYQV